MAAAAQPPPPGYNGFWDPDCGGFWAPPFKFTGSPPLLVRRGEAPYPPPRQVVSDSLFMLEALKATRGNVREMLIRWFSEVGWQRRKDVSHWGALRVSKMPPELQGRCMELAKSVAREYPSYGNNFFDPGNWLYGSAMRHLLCPVPDDMDPPGKSRAERDEALGDLAEAVLGAALILRESVMGAGRCPPKNWEHNVEIEWARQKIENACADAMQQLNW